MTQTSHSAPAAPSRRFALLVTVAVLVVLGTLVAGLTLRLRARLRAEVLHRESEALHSVALLQLASARARTPAIASQDSAALLYEAVLETSRLRGMLAVQLFDTEGRLLTALPDTGGGDALRLWWTGQLSAPVARFHPRASLEELFADELEPGAAPTRVPLLEVIVPLRLTPDASFPDGIARLWMSGDAIAGEFVRLDRGLLLQAGIAYAGTALLVAVLLGWAFRRMAEANRLLAERSADLLRANRELDFAAKTGAVGAISAHLIHGLKNPLAGLESFVADPPPSNGAPADGEAWRSAMDTTRRLRAMIQEVVAVLGDEELGRADYPLPVSEFLESVRLRHAGSATVAGIALLVDVEAHGTLLARTANLAGLVLSNLLRNAIDAAPRGSSVRLYARRLGDALELFVEDQGPGLPEPVRERLFQPVKSAKRDGGGIGLAISRQLARHAGGDIELVRSGTDGTLFCVRLPLTPEPDGTR